MRISWSQKEAIKQSDEDPDETISVESKSENSVKEELDNLEDNESFGTRSESKASGCSYSRCTNSDEDIGDHVVEIIEKTSNTGKNTLSLYVDWKYKYYLSKARGDFHYFSCTASVRAGTRCPSNVVVWKSLSDSEGKNII